MLHEEMIYVDRYICLQEITVESPEDYAQSATWSRPYMNNANTIVIFLRGSWSAKVEGSNYVFAPGEQCLIKRLESLYLMPTEDPGSFQRLSFSAH